MDLFQRVGAVKHCKVLYPVSGIDELQSGGEELQSGGEGLQTCDAA